jgi:hypothetical protein
MNSPYGPRSDFNYYFVDDCHIFTAASSHALLKTVTVTWENKYKHLYINAAGASALQNYLSSTTFNEKPEFYINNSFSLKSYDPEDMRRLFKEIVAQHNLPKDKAQLVSHLLENHTARSANEPPVTVN